MNQWTDNIMDEWMDEWMNEWMDAFLFPGPSFT